MKLLPVGPAYFSCLFAYFICRARGIPTPILGSQKQSRFYSCAKRLKSFPTKNHFPSLWNRNFPSNEQRMLKFLSLLRRAPSRNCRAVTLNFSVYKLPTNRRGPTVFHLFLKLFWRHASCKYSCCDVLSTEQSVFTSSELINAITWFVMALKQKAKRLCAKWTEGESAKATIFSSENLRVCSQSL